MEYLDTDHPKSEFSKTGKSYMAFSDQALEVILVTILLVTS